MSSYSQIVCETKPKKVDKKVDKKKMICCGGR